MPIDARYLLGMVVAFTVFQFGPKIVHKLHHHKPKTEFSVYKDPLYLKGDEAMLEVVCSVLDPTPVIVYNPRCEKFTVNLPVPDPNSRKNPLGQ